MAERAVVVTADSDPRQHSVRYGNWAGLLNGDTGAAFGEPSRSDRSVQVDGNFGAGGAVTWEGRNDASMDWGILHDLQGNDLVVTDNKVYQVAEITRQTRPHVTAGDGTTDLLASVTSRGDRDKT